MYFFLENILRHTTLGLQTMRP